MKKELKTIEVLVFSDTYNCQDLYKLADGIVGKMETIEKSLRFTLDKYLGSPSYTHVTTYDKLRDQLFHYTPDMMIIDATPNVQSGTQVAKYCVEKSIPFVMKYSIIDRETILKEIDPERKLLTESRECSLESELGLYVMTSCDCYGDDQIYRFVRNMHGKLDDIKLFSSQMVEK